MDTIIKALDRRQILVETMGDRHEYRKGNTFALVDSERIAFSLFESPTKGLREERWSKKMVGGMVPSGRLVLHIRGEYGGDRIQIRDQKRKTVQDRGGEGGIRTHGTVKPHNGFRDRRLRPLGHLSGYALRGKGIVAKNRAARPLRRGNRRAANEAERGEFPPRSVKLSVDIPPR